MILLPIFFIAVVLAVVIGSRGGPSRLTRTAVVVFLAIGVGMLALLVLPASLSDPWGRILAMVSLGAVAVALILAVVWLVRAPKVGLVDEWAVGHGVQVTGRNVEFVDAYVREGHRLRLVCGFGGWFVAQAVAAATGIDLHLPGLVWLLAGYLVGCVWSEAWLTRLPEGTERAASLTTRRLSDYLAGRLRTAQVVLPVLSVLLALVTWGVHPSRSELGRSGFLSTNAADLHSMAIAAGLAGPLVMLGIWLLERHIVMKPQPLVDHDLLAADDAVRSSSVHLLSGTGCAIVLTLMATMFTYLAEVDPGQSAGVPTFAAICCFLLALVSWRYYGHRGFRVLRSAGGGATPDPSPPPGSGPPPVGGGGTLVEPAPARVAAPGPLGATGGAQ
jgi:hypothetical protein